MNSILLNCIIYNLLASISLLLLIKKNPRYMMQDYPEEITKNIEAKTAKEKREYLRFGLPFILILLLYPLLFGLYGKFIFDYSFITNFLAILVILFSFNVVDLLILDWLIFCYITPKFIVIPGTEGHPGYQNYGYHMKGFLKGSGFAVIGSFVFALLIEGISLLIQ